MCRQGCTPPRHLYPNKLIIKHWSSEILFWYISRRTSERRRRMTPIIAPGTPDVSWRPLLEGQLAERAQVATRALADALYTVPLGDAPPASLYADLALLYTYLGRAGMDTGV